MTRLTDTTIARLIPEESPEVEHWRAASPPRDLPDGAWVTRFGPSFGKHLSLAAANVALVSQDAARRTGGVYLVREEDTDGAREVTEAVDILDQALAYLDLRSDETDVTGAYGPYRQSRRAQVYWSYTRQMLRQGDAYPCFATEADLDRIRERQRAEGAPLGCWGSWAEWRDAPEDDVVEALDAGRPYVVRFRSRRSPGERAEFTDEVHGRVTCDAYFIDVVILKSSTRTDWLPTYHFAHVVDDELMHVNLVVRGEEWIPSVPLHRDLIDALGHRHVHYAHVPSLMRMDNGKRRRLSGKLDSDTLVTSLEATGYEAAAVRHYLRQLYNPHLSGHAAADADGVTMDVRRMPTKQGVFDDARFRQVCTEHMASLSIDQAEAAARSWATRHRADLVATAPPTAWRAAVELARAPGRERDIASWSELVALSSFLFSTDHAPAALLRALDADVPELTAPDKQAVLTGAARLDTSDRELWFKELWDLTDTLLDGHAELSRPRDRRRCVGALMRTVLTGASSGPDMHDAILALGPQEARRRMDAVVHALAAPGAVVTSVEENR